MTPWIDLVDVTVSLGRRDVVRAVSAQVREGQLVVVVGPNGAGKSTLLRSIGGLVTTRSGTVRVLGLDPSAAPRRELARKLAYLPQAYELAFPYLVEDVVLLGRFAHQRGMGLPNESDLAAARAAMQACDVGHLASRRFDELSGGEARRVIIAQSLCQEARCLLLDEPTAGLDPAHARSVFTMLAEQCKQGRAAVVVTHDLDLAVRHATEVWLLDDGELRGRGPAPAVLGDDATRRAFGVDLHLGTLPSGVPFAVPG